MLFTIKYLLIIFCNKKIRCNFLATNNKNILCIYSFIFNISLLTFIKLLTKFILHLYFLFE